MATACPKIPKELSNEINLLSENHEPKDFKVNVDGETIPCHSSILASCSDFFRGLLRSEMKEKQEMEVELKNISSTTFQCILNSLYTGCELLTTENVCEVWSAVHQLQIQFLIEHCEDFVFKTISLETIGIYKKYSDYLQCEKINQCIFDFTCRCFQGFRKSEALLELNFEDFLKIIRSKTLQVSSVDEVLYSIFDWVSYGDFSMTYRIADDATQIPTNFHNLFVTSNATHISTNVNDSVDVTNTTQIATIVNNSSDLTNNSHISTNVIDSLDLSSTTHISTNINESSNPTNTTHISGNVNDSSVSSITTHRSTHVNELSDQSNVTHISTNANDSSDPTNASYISVDNNALDHNLERQTENPQNSAFDTELTNKRDIQESTHKVDLSERKTMLETLIGDINKRSASAFCLTELYYSNITQNDANVKDIILKHFSLCGYDHCFYSVSDIVKENSEVKLVGVYCNEKDVRVLSFKDNTCFSLSKLPLNGDLLPYYIFSKCNLAVYNGEIYACIKNAHYVYLHCAVSVLKLTPSGWKHVVDLNTCFSDQFITDGEYLYSINWMGIYKLNPKSNPIEVESFDFEIPLIQHAFIFHYDIILFKTESSENVAETIVYFWNRENRYLKKLQFFSYKMTSFVHRGDRYILDHSGRLYKLRYVCQWRKPFQFKYVGKLWYEHYFVDGAFLFNETLFLVGNIPEEKISLKKVDGVFSSIRILRGHYSCRSNIVHSVMPSYWKTLVSDNSL